MSDPHPGDGDPVIIKKYANRRLYNTATSSYVTLEDLAVMVKQGSDFVVYDAKSGTDLTHSVLTQIIFEQESKGVNLLPTKFLRQLIRFYGHSLQPLVPRFLEASIESLTREQDKFRETLTRSLGGDPFEAVEKQVQENFALFEKAMSQFSPFGTKPDPGPDPVETPVANPEEAGEAQAGKSDRGEIDALREQLSALQKQLDNLAKPSK